MAVTLWEGTANAMANYPSTGDVIHPARTHTASTTVPDPRRVAIAVQGSPYMGHDKNKARYHAMPAATLLQKSEARGCKAWAETLINAPSFTVASRTPGMAGADARVHCSLRFGPHNFMLGGNVFFWMAAPGLEPLKAFGLRSEQKNILAGVQSQKRVDLKNLWENWEACTRDAYQMTFAMAADSGVQHLGIKPLVPYDESGNTALQTGHMEPEDVLRPLLDAIVGTPVRKIVFMDIILDFAVTEEISRMMSQALSGFLQPDSLPGTADASTRDRLSARSRWRAVRDVAGIHSGRAFEHRSGQSARHKCRCLCRGRRRRSNWGWCRPPGCRGTPSRPPRRCCCHRRGPPRQPQR